MRQNLGCFGRVAKCVYAHPRLSAPVRLKCGAGQRGRFGPGCCRLVSSLGLALLGEDNRPASAGHTSADGIGCVRRLSDACKSLLLTRGTPRPFAPKMGTDPVSGNVYMSHAGSVPQDFAPVGTRDVRRETRLARYSFAEYSNREKENTALKVKPFREGGPCRVERAGARRFGEAAAGRKRGEERYSATKRHAAYGEAIRLEAGGGERERDRAPDPKRRTPPEVPCTARFGAAAGRTAFRCGAGRPDRPEGVLVYAEWSRTRVPRRVWEREHGCPETRRRLESTDTHRQAKTEQDLPLPKHCHITNLKHYSEA